MKGVISFLFTPKGLHNLAQGKRSVALGMGAANHPTLKGLDKTSIIAQILCNPFRVESRVSYFPRVAEAATLGFDVQPLRGKFVRFIASTPNLGTTVLTRHSSPITNH